MDKKLNKIVGLSKEEFDGFFESKQITARVARLIPFSKPGDEISLASVFMSSLKLIKEFRKQILSDLKMPSGGKLHVYTEVCFSGGKDRPDGLLVVEKAGLIVDAALIELKNGSNDLEVEQLERYASIAKELEIPRIVTISNQFVSEPTQSPVPMKNSKSLTFYHLSWSYILTVSHILLASNDTNIEDEDQKEIMKEVIHYFESDKSSVCGFNQMKKGWVETVKKIHSRISLKADDIETKEAVLSWQQEEMDIALKLSKCLGVIVSSGESKYKNDLSKRLEDDTKKLITTNSLNSGLKIKGAASRISITAFIDKRAVEMHVSVRPPHDKKIKGQMSWLEKQINLCQTKNKDEFSKIFPELFIDIEIKNTSRPERVSAKNFWDVYDHIKDKEIKEFGVVLFKDFGNDFSSRTKFVSTIEDMAMNFYKLLVEHLKNHEVTAPKMRTDVAQEDVRPVMESDHNQQIGPSDSIVSDQNSSAPVEFSVDDNNQKDNAA
jgi:hypothetical protein